MFKYLHPERRIPVAIQSQPRLAFAVSRAASGDSKCQMFTSRLILWGQSTAAESSSEGRGRLCQTGDRKGRIVGAFDAALMACRTAFNKISRWSDTRSHLFDNSRLQRSRRGDFLLADKGPGQRNVAVFVMLPHVAAVSRDDGSQVCLRCYAKLCAPGAGRNYEPGTDVGRGCLVSLFNEPDPVSEDNYGSGSMGHFDTAS